MHNGYRTFVGGHVTLRQIKSKPKSMHLAACTMSELRNRIHRICSPEVWGSLNKPVRFGDQHLFRIQKVFDAFAHYDSFCFVFGKLSCEITKVKHVVSKVLLDG